MLEHGATCSVSLTYVDRDGRKGRTKLFLPFDTEATSALQFGIDMDAAFQPVIQASLIEVKIVYEWRETEELVAEEGSNVYAKAVLFYRNEDGFETISIPSPKAEIFETAGTFSGIRVDAQVPQMEPWVIPPVAVVSAMATPEGDPFPTEYVVGGLAQ